MAHLSFTFASCGYSLGAAGAMMRHRDGHTAMARARLIRMGYAKAALLTLALASGTAWAAGSVPAMAKEQRAAFETITPDTLAQKLEHKDFIFINVHIPYEGEIGQTDAFIPFDQIAANLDKLPSDKSASIVLYCRSGRMSEIAATTLAALGYSRVAHLQGGFNAWAQSGRVLLQHARP